MSKVTVTSNYDKDDLGYYITFSNGKRLFALRGHSLQDKISINLLFKLVRELEEYAV